MAHLKGGVTPEHVGGGRYDLMVKSTSTLIARSVRGIKVQSTAQSFLTPAFLKSIDGIFKDFEGVPEDI